MPSELSPDTNKASDSQPVDSKTRLQRKYGTDFPSPDSVDGAAWRIWIESQRKRQEPVMRDKRLHWSRHRHFKASQQWISTRDGRTWREPQADTNDVRPVLNIIGPALDFRLGLLMEQRPGFRHEPIGGGIAGREAAEAQQAVAEFYFYAHRAWTLFLDALMHAQTDGASFVHLFVDWDKGPKTEDVDLIPPSDERYTGLQSQGYEVRPDGLLMLPYAEEGIPAPPGAAARQLPQGDIAARVLLAHEVLFDAEARTVNGPTDAAKWCVVRRMRDVALARLETGEDKIESEVTITSQSDVLDMPIDRAMGWQRGLPPFPTRRQRLQDGVPEYLLFLAPNPEEPLLEKGMWLRIVGNKIVDRGDELPGGVIPLARFTDGSSDADIFPRPVMSDWIGDQVAINALLGTLLKHARWFAGGRILSLKNTLVEESYSTIVGSLIEYQGQKPEVLPSPEAGGDAWRLLDFLIKQLENKHGWNDIARGQVSGDGSMQDVSGRALLGARELFERTFGPAVRAASEGATEYAHIVVRYAQWLFDEPRMIPVVNGRGDLAKRIAGEHLGDRPLVYVDPETLMPLPRALRNQMLFDLLEKGLISLDTYQKRAPYADIRNVQMNDGDQWQRAQWVNTILEERWEDLLQQEPEQVYMPTNGIVVWWQDDPTAHKAALQELILDERRPFPLRKLASERWAVYDQLERAKADPTAMYTIPPEVAGVPADRMAMQPAAQRPSGQPLQGQAGAKPGGAAPGVSAQPGVSPAPESTGGGAPPVSQQQGAQPLGQMGAIEHATQNPQALEQH